MQIRSVGIDLGKTTFHLVALGDNGKALRMSCAGCGKRSLILIVSGAVVN